MKRSEYEEIKWNAIKEVSETMYNFQMKLSKEEYDGISKFLMELSSKMYDRGYYEGEKSI